VTQRPTYIRAVIKGGLADDTPGKVSCVCGSRFLDMDGLAEHAARCPQYARARRGPQR
jgi:hypothetical protein